MTPSGPQMVPIGSMPPGTAVAPGVMMAPAPGMMMGPGGMMMAPMMAPVMAPADPWAILAMQKKLFIKQKIELLEVLTGFETENRYEVYDGTKSQHLFKAKEVSDCCARICCANMRAFNMGVMMAGFKDLSASWLTYSRPFKCVFPCCNRPVLYAKKCVPAAAEGVPHFASSTNPFACCSMVFEIRNDKDEVVYRVDGSSCQAGMFCMCPCSPCNKITFPILPADGSPVQLGVIEKQWSGCGKEAFTDADNFFIEFPDGATPEMKAIMLGTVFLIDFLYFENKQNKRGGAGGGITIS